MSTKRHKTTDGEQLERETKWLQKDTKCYKETQKGFSEIHNGYKNTIAPKSKKITIKLQKNCTDELLFIINIIITKSY